MPPFFISIADTKASAGSNWTWFEIINNCDVDCPSSVTKALSLKLVPRICIAVAKIAALLPSFIVKVDNVLQ